MPRTQKSVTSIMEGEHPWIDAKTSWTRKKGPEGNNCQAASHKNVTLICTVYCLLTERILNQARGPSVPLHILAWAWGALSRHWTVVLYTESEGLYTSWCRPCGGPLQVTGSSPTAVTFTDITTTNQQTNSKYVTNRLYLRILIIFRYIIEQIYRVFRFLFMKQSEAGLALTALLALTAGYNLPCFFLLFTLAFT